MKLPPAVRPPAAGALLRLPAHLAPLSQRWSATSRSAKRNISACRGKWKSVLKQSEALRASFAKLIDDDAEAFNTVMSAFNLPKETEEEKTKRAEAIQQATKSATEIPLHVMQLCEQALVLTQAAAEKGNVNSISDAGVAALMLHAACLGAKLNVQINLGSLKDALFVQETTSRTETLSKHVEAMSRDILKRVNESLSPAHS